MKSYTQLKLALYFLSERVNRAFLYARKAKGPPPTTVPCNGTLRSHTGKSGRRSTTLLSKTWVSVCNGENSSPTPACRYIFRKTFPPPPTNALTHKVLLLSCSD